VVDVHYRLSLPNIEDLLHERGIDITHDTVRFWRNRFGTISAAEIRQRRVAAMRHFRHCRGHLDEAFFNSPGVKSSPSRAVGHEGEAFDDCATKKRGSEFSDFIAAGEFS
jgi:putative transposase